MNNKLSKSFSLFIVIIFYYIILIAQIVYAASNVDYLLEQEGENKTISMVFNQEPLNNVLKIFSQQSGMNFITASGVSNLGIDLYLDKVPVEEALERILSANNLTYEIKPGSNIFVVKPATQPVDDRITRVYKLKFASVPSAPINETLSASEAEGVSRVTETKSETGIVAVLTPLLSNQGRIVEDVRTNSLIITDFPSRFLSIEQTIARLDIRIPQILIESEMLDVSKTIIDKLGAKYAESIFQFDGGASSTTYYPFDSDHVIDEGGAGRSFDGTTFSFPLQLTLDFLRTHTDTKNLARPRILTLNNQTAEIKISSQETIGPGTVSTDDSGRSIIGEGQRAETGVFLKVTPQANLVTREITLAVEPKVIQTRAGATFFGFTYKDPEERGSKSFLRIKDGNTIVIGGLLRTDSTDTKTSIPVISKVPFLGAGFRHKDLDNKERELIIFLTPHIVSEDTGMNQIASKDQFIREQSIPNQKMDKISKELSLAEKQRL